jgi:membrane-bound inhibitor of C-type lysozyme
MAKPNSRATLISFCKRALGHPVIEINVDEDQVDDRIDEALQFYQEYHADAVEKVYLKHLVTNTDRNNGYVTVPDLVTSVLRLMPLTESSTSVGMFDIKYQIMLNDVHSMGGMGQVHDFTMKMQHLALLDNLLNSDEKNVDFNRHKNQLRINMDWKRETQVPDDVTVVVTVANPGSGNRYYFDGQLTPNKALSIGSTVTFDQSHASNNGHPLRFSTTANGTHASGSQYATGVTTAGTPGSSGASTKLVVTDTTPSLYYYCVNHSGMGSTGLLTPELTAGKFTYLVLECFRIVDPTAYTDVYNDYYLKRYATALIKRQWGINLSKFEGMVMPGGVTFNGRQILEDANEEIIKLEEEARLNWETPIDFLIG